MIEQWEDYYSILQVHPDAETEIIQTAYKRLCKKYHPDVNPSPGAAEKIKRINNAYEVLGDNLRRRTYHTEWLRKSTMARSAAPVAQPQTIVRERVVYREAPRPAAPPPPPQRDNGTQAARRVIEEYFTALARGKYKECFGLLSDEDRRHFDYSSYAEWQSSVGHVYELGTFSVSLFKRHIDFHYPGGGKKLPAEEFTIAVAEKNKKDGQVREYSFTKYAVQEGSRWRVYLGYQDLNPLMRQFKTETPPKPEVHKAETARSKAAAPPPKTATPPPKTAATPPKVETPPADPQMLAYWQEYKKQNDATMGLPNRVGFEKKLAPEVYRFKRYARPFSVAVLQVSIPDSRGATAELQCSVNKYVGYIIQKTLRFIDSVGYLGNNCFAILFAETGKRSGSQAARRVLKAVRHDVASCFDFEVALRVGVTEYSGNNLDDLVAICLRTISNVAAQ